MISAWTINGVSFATSGKLVDKLGTDAYLLPDNLEATPDNTTNDIVAKLADYIQRIGLERIGSALATGVDGRLVAQSMSDVTIICSNRSSFVAGISSAPGTLAYNVFAFTDMTFASNYVLKNTSTSCRYMLSTDTYTANVEYSITSSSASIADATTGIFAVQVDGDPFTNDGSRAGTMRAVKFTIAAIPGLVNATSDMVPNEISIAELYGSINRTSVPYKFHVDTLLRTRIPIFNSAYISAVSAAITYISGVPRFTTSATITVIVIVNNLITEFYNNTRILSIASAQTQAVNYMPSSGAITTMYAAPTNYYAFTMNTTLLPNTYSASNLSLTITAYTAGDAASTSTSAVYGSGEISVDTTASSSVEAAIRIPCMTGQYPSTGCNTAAVGTYDSTLSIANLEELQLLGNRFVFPSINYSTQYPVGPNYASLTAPTYDSMRWVAGAYPTANGTVSGGTITITGASADFTLVNTIRVYIKLTDSGPWLDPLSPYDPTVTTIANGYACGIYHYPDDNIGLNYMSGGNWVIPFTAYAAINTNYIFIRVSIKSTSGHSFERVTATLFD